MKLLNILVFFSIFFIVGCISSEEARYKDQLKKAKLDKRVNSYIKLATDALYKKQFPSAYEHLFKAENLDPNNADVKNILGLVYYYDNDLNNAFKKFKKATELRPKYSEAHNHLGIIYSQKGEYKKALKHFNIALSNLLYRTPWIVHTNIGKTYIAMKDYTKGLKHLKTSIDKNKNQCIPQLYIGYIYEQYKEYDKALFYYNESLKKCKAAPTYKTIGMVMIKLKENKKALENFNFCKEIASKNGDLSLLKECKDYIKLLEE